MAHNLDFFLLPPHRFRTNIFDKNMSDVVEILLAYQEELMPGIDPTNTGYLVQVDSADSL